MSDPSRGVREYNMWLKFTRLKGEVELLKERLERYGNSMEATWAKEALTNLEAICYSLNLRRTFK